MENRDTEHAALLRAFLAKGDERCPSCGYALRGLAGGECPECGARLRLTVREAGDRGSFTAGVVALAVSVGIQVMMLVASAGELGAVRAAIRASALGVAVAALVAWIVARRPLDRMRDRDRAVLLAIAVAWPFLLFGATILCEEW